MHFQEQKYLDIFNLTYLSDKKSIAVFIILHQKLEIIKRSHSLSNLNYIYAGR